jgi:hypothetical protein
LRAPLAAKERQKQKRKEKKKKAANQPDNPHIPLQETIRYDENGSVHSGDAVYVLDTLKNRIRRILKYNLAFELMEKIGCVWYT